MKKIAILSAVNMKHMSLISLYTNILEEKGISYDIIYMDKYGEIEETSAKNVYRFENTINHNWSRPKKILRHFRFFGYAKKVLEKNKYDFVIVWNDIAITMFGLYLASKWRGKYCLNVRDYNGEKKWYIYRIFEKAVKESAFTTISSEGFKSFLPKHDYISLYSYNDSLLSEIEPRSRKQEQGRPIRISFVGNVRFFPVNKKLVDSFKNDSRFELHYHGANAEQMESYARDTGADNVVCSGSFPITDTKKYLEKTDIVNNIFGNGTYGVRTLTSIRLFHAAYLNIPIMVSTGTYMQEVVDKFGIGYVVEDIDEKLPDRVYYWYSNLNQEALNKGAQELLDEAKEANAAFRKVVEDWIV